VFFASSDTGHTWSGPHYVLPRTEGHEFDFVELPDGQLLFFLSSIQSNQPARQIVRREEGRFVNDPMMDVRRGATTDEDPCGGFTPETIVVRSDGLLIGGRRGSPYVCSNDLGENWYEIEGAPPAEYQPMMVLLPDDRVLTVWHHGGDTALGEYDMFIGTHGFRVEADLPQPTRLTLERELSADGKQYVNTFRARLSAGSEPVPGRTVELRVRNTWRPQPDGRENPVSVFDSPDVRRSMTDEKGIARFELNDKAVINDLHHNYGLAATFTPGPEEHLAGSTSRTLSAYALTHRRDDTAPYPIYNVHGLLMVTPETAERFPELEKIVEHFRMPDPDAPLERWIEIVGNEKRAREIVDFLVDHHILRKDDEGMLRWYRAVHSGGPGEPYIHGVRVCDVKEYCI
jgi:hypothetical protein